MGISPFYSYLEGLGAHRFWTRKANRSWQWQGRLGCCCDHPNWFAGRLRSRSHLMEWWGNDGQMDGKNDGKMMETWWNNDGKMMDKWIGVAQNPMGDHQHEQTAHRVAHFQVRHECSSTWSAMAERLQPFEDPVREFQKTQQAGWRATRSWGNLKQQI